MAVGNRGVLDAMISASVAESQQELAATVRGDSLSGPNPGKDPEDLPGPPMAEDENEDDIDIDGVTEGEITKANEADLTDEEDEAILRQESPANDDETIANETAAPQAESQAPDGQASEPSEGQPPAEDEDADLVRLTEGQIRNKTQAVEFIRQQREQVQHLESLKGRMGAENGQLRSRIRLLESQIGLALRMKGPDQLSPEEEQHYRALAERTGQSVEALLYLDQRDAMRDFAGQREYYEQAIERSRYGTREYIERHPKTAEYELEAKELLEREYAPIVGALQNSVPDQMLEASTKFVDLLYNSVELGRTRNKLSSVEKELSDLKNSMAARDEAIRRQILAEMQEQSSVKRVVAGSQAARTSDRVRNVHSEGPGRGGSRDWLRNIVDG